MVKKTYNIIFIVLIVVLLLPVLQQIVDFPKVAGLKGYFVEAKKPNLTAIGLWNGSYQDSLNKYVEDHIGFRPDLVRIHNTVDYYCFDKTNANNVIFGKDNYTFEKGYIDATLGRDYIGTEAIENKAKKAAFLQEYYNNKSIELIFLFAPGKGTYFSEYIPDNFYPDSSTTSNYQTYIEAFEKLNIDYIDYNGWFLEMKDTIPYPLYPQYGIHWSQYGMILALDSLVHYIEVKSGKEMVEPEWEMVDVSRKMRETDYDLGKALNLLWQLPTYELGYPKLHWEKKTDKYAPKLACISDSYFWNWYGTGMTNKIFGKTNFLYYFKQHYSSEWSGVRKVSDLEIIPFLEDHEIILVMFTDGNLKDMSYGFIDQMYDNLNLTQTTSLEFDYINSNYIDHSESDNTYTIKKGTPMGNTVLKVKKLNISPNTSYIISYEAKGFEVLEMDLYPNVDVKVHANTEIKSEEWQKFFWQFNSGNHNGKSNLRVYMDYRPEFGENTYIRNVKINKLQN